MEVGEELGAVGPVTPAAVQPVARLLGNVAGAVVPDEVKLTRARRTPSGGWVVKLTDAPLDDDNPAHLDALKWAYERFPKIGGRDSPR
jgi:hypothetical protein